MVKFKDRLTQLRKEEGLSQEDLAVRVGVSRSTIGMYETGKREPDLETLETFADFFNVNLEYLIGRTGNIKPDDLTLKETDLIENFKKLDNDDKEKVVEYTKALQQKKPVLIIENEPRYLVRRAGRDGSFSEEYLTKKEIEKIKEEANALEEANF